MEESHDSLVETVFRKAIRLGRDRKTTMLRIPHLLVSSPLS